MTQCSGAGNPNLALVAVRPDGGQSRLQVRAGLESRSRTATPQAKSLPYLFFLPISPFLHHAFIPPAELSVPAVLQYSLWLAIEQLLDSVRQRTHQCCRATDDCKGRDGLPREGHGESQARQLYGLLADLCAAISQRLISKIVCTHRNRVNEVQNPAKSLRAALHFLNSSFLYGMRWPSKARKFGQRSLHPVRYLAIYRPTTPRLFARTTGLS